MKKLILLLVVLVAVSAAQAGPTFTFNYEQFEQFQVIDSATTFTGSVNFNTYTQDLGYWGNPALVAPAIGYTGTSGGAAGYVGVGYDFGTTGIDLTNTDTLNLSIHNDNNQNWNYRLFVDNGSEVLTSDWVQVPVTTGTWLSMDTTSIDNAVAMGFQIQIPGNQSDEFHTSVSVPVPGAFLLGGLGVACVGWIKRRKSL